MGQLLKGSHEFALDKHQVLGLYRLGIEDHAASQASY